VQTRRHPQHRRSKGDNNKAYTQSDSPGGSTGGKVVMSTIALFTSRLRTDEEITIFVLCWLSRVGFVVGKYERD